jgi:hypothetical protein
LEVAVAVIMRNAVERMGTLCRLGALGIERLVADLLEPLAHAEPSRSTVLRPLCVARLWPRKEPLLQERLEPSLFPVNGDDDGALACLRNPIVRDIDDTLEELVIWKTLSEEVDDARLASTSTHSERQNRPNVLCNNDSRLENLRDGREF